MPSIPARSPLMLLPVRLLCLAFCLFLCALLADGEVLAQDVDRHDDTIDAATDLTLGGSVHGVINAAGDVDYLRLRYPAKQRPSTFGFTPAGPPIPSGPSMTTLAL